MILFNRNFFAYFAYFALTIIVSDEHITVADVLAIAVALPSISAFSPVIVAVFSIPIVLVVLIFVFVLLILGLSLPVIEPAVELLHFIDGL